MKGSKRYKKIDKSNIRILPFLVTFLIYNMDLDNRITPSLFILHYLAIKKEKREFEKLAHLVARIPFILISTMTFKKH